MYRWKVKKYECFGKHKIQHPRKSREIKKKLDEHLDIVKLISEADWDLDWMEFDI